MLIGIDCRLWNQTGVGRYTRNLIFNLFQIDKKNEYILFIRSDDENDIKNQIPKLKIPNSKFKIVLADIPWHSVSEQIKFASILNSYKLDLVHFPYFSVPIFYRKKYVVTVHDLITNKYKTGKASTLPYPLYLSKRLAYKLVLKNALKKSKTIIVPSFAVKNDLLHAYKNINPGKIEVTYEGGFEKQEKEYIDKKYGKYFLRVGNFYPHKNVNTLLTGFKIFIEKAKDKKIKLVLVGKKDFFYKDIENKINNLNLSKNVVFVENPKDQELIPLYKNSIATVVPSFMEGFSLTAVEAMSKGAIVILSDIAVHREICGDLAFYFNQNDVYGLFEQLTRVNSLKTSDKEILQTKEKDMALNFSWKKMAQQTLRIYESSFSL